MNCNNCFTAFTPQWRSINNKTYCNSCACCYFRHKYFIPPEKIYAKVLMDMSKGKVF